MTIKQLIDCLQFCDFDEEVHVLDSTGAYGTPAIQRVVKTKKVGKKFVQTSIILLTADEDE